MKTEQPAAKKRMSMVWYSLGLALLLAACSSMEEMFDEPIEPSMSTASTSEDARTLAPISSDASPQPSPTAAATPPPDMPPSQHVVPINPTGTFVGDKTVQIGGDFANLQQSVQTHGGQYAQSHAASERLIGQYYSTIASINTRLQVGTTAGNPQLGQRWDEAQAKLMETSGNVMRLQELRGLVASDTATARLLQDQVQAAFSLSGATEEDHRQLAMLDEGINRESAAIERLLALIDTSVTRQSAYVANERLNMTTLALAIKRGEPYGPDGSNGLPAKAASNTAATTSRASPSSIARSTAPSKKAAKSSSGPVSARRRILVIDFGSASASYEPNLYAAVSEVIASRPSARFEVVGVTPAAKPGASAAATRRNAKRVVRSLVNMGMPESRLRETARTSQSATSEQVLVYTL